MRDSRDNGIISFLGKYLSPLSGFMSIIMGALISTLIPVYFKNEVSTLEKVTVIWICAFVFYIIFDGIRNYYINQINRLNCVIIEKDAKIEELDKQIKNNMGLIEGKYGEFSSYLEKDKCKDMLSKLVDKFSYLEAVHLYDYNISKRCDKIIFHVNFFIGMESEGIDVNLIKQAYFYIDKDIYSDFRDFDDYYCNNFTPNEPNDVSTLGKKGENLSHKLINNITPENIRIFNLVANTLIKVNEDFAIKGFMPIKNIGRNGLLGCLISDQDAKYYYIDNKDESDKNINNKNNTKINRMYFSFKDIFDGKSKIVTFIIDIDSTKIFEGEDENILIKEVINYYEELKK